MAIVYNWVISAMNEYPTTPDGLNNVVFTIHWRRNATEIVDGKTYFADTYGAQGVSAPDPDTELTPYEDLTFEQICGWLEASMDVAVIDAGLAQKIENQINPPVVSLPLPWDVSPSTTTTTTEPPSTTSTTTTTEP